MHDSAKRSFPAWLMLGFGLLLTVFASLQVKQGIERDAADRFSFVCDQVALKIQQRLVAYALILRGGEALFSASAAVNRKEWRAYVDTLRVADSVPGVQGIGFAERIAPDALAGHVARIRGEGFPGYAVRPPGRRDVYTSIIYLEPFSGRNLRAFGYDMFSESVRRAAMERARDTGDAALSGKVELVQETGQDVQAGTLMYVPVYRQGMPTGTLAQKRAALSGWVYSPFRMNDLMTGILADWAKHESRLKNLEIYDGSAIMPGALLFDSQPAPLRHSLSLLHQQRTIDFNGRPWLLVFDGSDALSNIGYAPMWATLIGGIVFSGLLFGLMLSVIDTRARAARIAAGLTEELGQLNRRFSLAADSAQIGVWDYLIPERKLIWDRWMHSLYGISAEDFPGTADAWKQNVHPDDVPACEAALTRALHGASDVHSEFRVIWPDGSLHYLLATATVERDGSGAPLRVTGAVYDISERKQAEIELKRGREMLRLILDSTAEAIYGIDLDGRCTFSNRACRELLGYDSEEELLGRDMHAQIHHSFADGTSFPVTRCRIFSAFQRGQGTHVDDEVLWRKDLSSFPAEYWSYPQAIDGKIVGAVVTFIDISQRKQVEQRLIGAMEAAERANVAKSRFLATMSHEIRTPLNGVLGMAQLLLADEVSADERRDYAHTILGSGRTLLALLNDILDLSKVEAGKLNLESTEVDPLAIVAKVKALFLETARQKGIVLSTRTRLAAPAYIGDRYRLMQMLSNLVTNAIKFTAQGEVAIEVNELGREGDVAILEFAVADTGIGIAADKLPLLFKPFSQADGSTTRQFGGSGLGLAIVGKLAQLMNGEVGVDSEAGKGSRFWFRVRVGVRVGVVPAGNASGDAGQVAVVAPAKQHFAGRVLAVDDSPVNRKLIAAILAKLGVATIAAEDGQRGVDAVLSGEAFDLVLMDLHMPVIDGYAATTQIRQWEKETQRAPLPIIALSADAFAASRQQALDCGMNDFLAKPFQVDALQALLARWLPAR